MGKVEDQSELYNRILGKGQLLATPNSSGNRTEKELQLGPWKPLSPQRQQESESFFSAEGETEDLGAWDLRNV